ncbi:MAG: hypothetical protein QOE82_2209 [Thermoanaerobaculia bacterium]|nr:hypothetical protein [Thermoanaerobaculia bacterium]
MLSRRARESLTIAALLAVVTFFFLDILLAGLNLYTRDIARVYYPERAALRTILRAGELPLWNPFAAGGQPLAANPGYETFYPPQWLLALGPLRDMFHIEIVLHYLLAAFGMYLLGRSLGLSRVASAYGGFAWALGGLMLALSNLLPFLFSAAWLPWVAFTFRRYLADSSIRRLAIAALPLAMIFLAADVSMMLQTSALLAAFAIYDARRTSHWKRALGGAIAIGVIAFAIAAVQLIPALDFQRDSGRSIPLDLTTATFWSMPASRLLELVWPTMFGAASPDAVFFWGAKHLYPQESIPYYLSIYPGILSILLIAAGFIRRIRGAGFVALIAAISFLLALGKHGPIFPLLYRLGLQSLRYPEKFALSGIFVLSVFAMIAAEVAMRDAAMQRMAFRIGVVIAAITLTFVLATSDVRFANVWQLAAPDPDLAQRFRHGMLMTLVFTALAAILFRADRLSPRLRLILLAATSLIDLGTRVTSTMPRTTADYYTPPLAARALAASGEPIRIYSHADWQRRIKPETSLPFGLRRWILRNGLLPSSEMTWGFEGILDTDVTSTNLLPMMRFQRLFDAARTHRTDRLPLLLQMSGASHAGVLKPYDPAVVADPTRFDQIEPVAFVPTRNAGRIYFADRVVAGFEEIDVGRAVFSEEPLSPRTAFTDVAFAPAVGRVLASHVTANHIDADVVATGQAFLLLAITRHKYWSATIDGSPATLHPANVAFQGVVVAPGRHHLALRYWNPVIAVCGWISLAALLATIYFACRRTS